MIIDVSTMSDAEAVIASVRDRIGLAVLATGRYAISDLSRRSLDVSPPVIACDELWSRSEGRAVARVTATWEPLEDRMTITGEQLGG